MLRVTGRRLKLNVLGRETREAAGVRNVKNMLVRNAFVMGLFEKQKNLTQVKVQGKTRSMVHVIGWEENILIFK